MATSSEQAVAEGTTEQDAGGVARSDREAIRDAYKSVVSTAGFRSRSGQRLMIAQVANTLVGKGDGERIIAIEGPTGTGKSLGYLLPAIVLARSMDKHLVLSTATVALQEQLVNRDLPKVRADSGLSFSWALAKGRRRYVCDRNLHRLAGTDDRQQSLIDDTTGQWDFRPAPEDIETVGRMAEARLDRSWTGDIDDWPTQPKQPLAAAITTDSSGCTGRACPFHDGCAFYAARNARHDKDIIVTNHAFLMADLKLGGGVTLPEPEETFHIIDEGHRLPDIAARQGAAQMHLIGPKQWLEDIGQTLTRTLTHLSDAHVLTGNRYDVLAGKTKDLDDQCQTLTGRLDELAVTLRRQHPALNDNGNAPRDPFSDERIWRMPDGRMAASLVPLFANAHDVAVTAFGLVESTADTLRKLLQENPDGNSMIESGLAGVQWAAGRLGQMVEALTLLAERNAEQPWPVARWIECLNDGDDFLCQAAPTNAGHLLRETLWDRSAGAVITSATLAALGRFDRFFEQAGLSASEYGTRRLLLTSPFDYRHNATLHIPRDMPEPARGNADNHTRAIIDRFNGGLIDPNEATLVLFTSKRQMGEVAVALTPALKELLSVQDLDGLSRADILADHRQRIEAGHGSILFGVNAFAEGLDLPGRECSHVIIAKLPFPVPDSPLDRTRSEWLEHCNRNPFRELSLPEAGFRLKQAVGRLLRSETDTGRITILDPRLTSRWYGKQMLASLPPFGRG